MKIMTHMERLLAALYVSEVWWASWLLRKKLHYKARAVVVFDRVLQHEYWEQAAAYGIKGDA